ncbi:MAG: preprotein translocase subunit SecE [Pseudomonadota bacterium]|nr:preprotein translocase subunit SecE [Pseudomonadota bacterium]
MDPPKPKVSPVEFGNQVRAEGRKITWPSRRETWITSVFVAVFVLLAAAFFALVDGMLSFLLQAALDLVNR